MSTPAPGSTAAIAHYDGRPFFEKALQFGVQHGILDAACLDAIRIDAPKGMVQIARYFGNEFLRPDLEKAKERIVNLVSLSLESSSGGDLQQAAQALRDHSFMSRSKAGSDMLRAMLALPESSSFEPELDDHAASPNSPPKRLAEWTLKSLADYQRELARRLPLQHEKEAALWFAEHYDLAQDELEETLAQAQAVIRTGLLLASAPARKKAIEMPDWPAFEALIVSFRKKQATARTLPAVVIPAKLPEAFHAVVQSVQDTLARDWPLILDASQPPRSLFMMENDARTPPLLGRYFWREDIASELAQFEEATSNAWNKITAGHCDDGSLLTLFVCVAAGLSPKTVMSTRTATAMVRKFQKAGAASGFDVQAAREFILTDAPAQHQSEYLALWDEFSEELHTALRNDAAFALEDALSLLRRECHVK